MPDPIASPRGLKDYDSVADYITGESLLDTLLESFPLISQMRWEKSLTQDEKREAMKSHRAQFAATKYLQRPTEVTKLPFAHLPNFMRVDLKAEPALTEEYLRGSGDDTYRGYFKPMSNVLDPLALINHRLEAYAFLTPDSLISPFEWVWIKDTHDSTWFIVCATTFNSTDMALVLTDKEEMLMDYTGYDFSSTDYDRPVRNAIDPPAAGMLDFGSMKDSDDMLARGQAYQDEHIWDAMEDLNEVLSDPTINENEGPEGTHDLTWVNGSEESLQAQLNHLLWTVFPEKSWVGNHKILSIRANSQDDPAHWDSETYAYENSERDLLSNDQIQTALMPLIEMLLELNTPSGWSWEYNDGAYHRKSGYYPSAELVTLHVHNPSAHDRMRAKKAFFKYCTQHRQDVKRIKLQMEAVELLVSSPA